MRAGLKRGAYNHEREEGKPSERWILDFIAGIRSRRVNQERKEKTRNSIHRMG